MIPARRPERGLGAVAAAVEPNVVTISVQTVTSSGEGSGVIIRSDGTILTNKHAAALRAGDTVLAVGSPLGLAGSVTSGIVSFSGLTTAYVAAACTRLPSTGKPARAARSYSSSTATTVRPAASRNEAATEAR